MPPQRHRRSCRDEPRASSQSKACARDGHPVPPSLREAILSDREFKARNEIEAEFELTLHPMEISIARSKLFAAIRSALADQPDSANGIPIEGSDCGVEFAVLDGRRKMLLRTPRGIVELPDYSSLSPRAEERLRWFDQEAHAATPEDEAIQKWRAILAARPVGDDEVEELQAELELAPGAVAKAIARELTRDELRISVLVPRERRYYERLVGRLDGVDNLQDFASTTGRRHVTALLHRSGLDGLRQATLMASNVLITDSIAGAAEHLAAPAWEEFFDWLRDSGDTVSQIGAIELAFGLLDRFSQFETALGNLIEIASGDLPPAETGRLSLLSHLVILVDGELTRTGALRGQPPFWRRLAAIAQASLIERAIVAAGASAEVFIEWAKQARGQPYYLQTMIDLRREPRWLPDYISPKQLYAEFSGRTYAAAHRNADKIQLRELRTKALEGESSVYARLEFPFAFLPGPLEGAIRQAASCRRRLRSNFVRGSSTLS